MILSELLNKLTELPERCLEYEVIYSPDDTLQKIVKISYDDELKLIWLEDEFEDK